MIHSIMNSNIERQSIMKKIHLILVSLATVSLASCQHEIPIDDTPLEDNEFRISLQGPKPTKAEDIYEPQITSFLVEKDEESGKAYYLEETVEILSFTSGPDTKGTPAYTENIGVLYQKLNAIAKDGSSETSLQFCVMDPPAQAGSGWRYKGEFNWEKDSYDFYFRMPEDMENNGVTNLSYGESNGKQTISFNYTSPNTTNSSAASQQDLLFAARTITKGDVQENRSTGVPVLFHHALTGVKFRIVNNDEKTIGDGGIHPSKHTETYITKVTISGLKNTGTCTITPREETNGYIDDKTGDYSSGAAGVVTWTSSGSGTFSQSFEETNIVDFESGAGSFDKNGDYPSSFSAAGNKNNLNDADASMTFWFIPQEMTDDVVLTVEFHVWDGDQNQATKKLSVNFGEIAKTNELTKDWRAGELRTFSLKPLDVNVELRDKMDDDKFIKSDVYIKNTGNVSEYVRVYIVGNWVGERQIDANKFNDYDSILMGYTNATQDSNGNYTSQEEVARWNDKDFTGTEQNKVYPDWTSPGGTVYHYSPYGEFVGLPPMGTATSGGTMVNYWVRHDKFYYYTKPIGPGASLPDSDPLFTSYTVGPSPDFYIADNTGVRRLARNVHLVMDLSVQAIAAEDGDGRIMSYDEAWKKALSGNASNWQDFNLNDL